MSAKSQQTEVRGSSPQLEEMIGAVERKVHDYFLHHHLAHWHPISTAPNNHDLELKILEHGTAAILPFPCRRTNGGEWINADLGTSIRIEPAMWRPWLKPKMP